MPRLTQSVPKYRYHKASGQAIVSIAGDDHYLGPWQSKASRIKYDQLIGEWLARGRQPEVEVARLTIAVLLARYLRFAKTYYVKHGKPTGELDNICHSMKPLRALYGHSLAEEFGPLRLKAVRQRMIESGLCRSVINARIRSLTRIFRWGVSEELVSETVYNALAEVAGLKKGRSNVREAAPVKPVADRIVDATLPQLPSVVADMVRFQRLTGCRPSEVCMLRPYDIDRTGDVWAYYPGAHKMEHKDRDRVIFIGPRAQAVLMPYLLRDAEAYCFSPRESESKRKALARTQRKTKVQPSQVDRSKAKPRRKPGTRYDSASYRTAVHRGCDKSFGAAEGPLTWDQLITMSQQHKLKPTDMLRHGKRNRWKRAISVRGMFPKLRPYNAATKSPPESEWYFKSAVPRWSPNQLRHTTGTALRKQFGLEAAQVVLGHSKCGTTEIYAERDLAKAAGIMRVVG